MRAPSWSRSKTAPRAMSSFTRVGPSSTSTRTASTSHSSTPAASVSARCRSAKRDLRGFGVDAGGLATADRDRPIAVVDVDDDRGVVLELGPVVLAVGDDDDLVARVHEPGSGAVQADLARSRLAQDGV